MAEMTGYILMAAFALDCLAGDPRWLPHPIVWMGRVISRLEPVFRRLIPSEATAGLAFALALIFGTWALATLVVCLAFFIHPAAAGAVQAIMLFYCFSVRSLVQAAMDVAAPLARGDLARARIMVGYIVGRETRDLDAPAVARAAVETVAENFVDGFLSPLVFALVLGAPGAMAYKMVNTLDSMVGYKNDTYLWFGRASARIDDVANYIPARMSVLVICLAAALLSPARGARAWKTARSQGRNHKSPNAGYPEAAFAGALGVRMGGPNVYHGKRVEKPYIGGAFPDPDVTRISRACELMVLSALVALAVACLAALVR